jgi:hypothetical protein
MLSEYEEMAVEMRRVMAETLNRVIYIGDPSVEADRYSRTRGINRTRRIISDAYTHEWDEREAARKEESRILRDPIAMIYRICGLL